ncbi:hypothetical protein PHMEG_00017042 [Phytophthora megakarya]|uniref:Uncharacterized protein n=1 Tax=Phytophthora megakarya TaxID=4795 RepID=A0A225VYD5_9STRA|nr:hypothetical protein PHMEG_00017042 [Phytophthora megakarya]
MTLTRNMVYCSRIPKSRHGHWGQTSSFPFEDGNRAKVKVEQRKTIGGSTVCGYTNTIHPRTPAVKQLVKNVQTQTTATKKKNYEDRGIGSLLDGYSSVDLVE